MAHFKNLDRVLNAVYLESLADTVIVSLFTDTQRTITFKDNIIDLISSNIMNIIMANRRANQSVVDRLISVSSIYTIIGSLTNKRCYTLPSASTLATTFTAQAMATKGYLSIISLMTGTIFVPNNYYNPNDFTGFSITRIVPPAPGNLAT